MVKLEVGYPGRGAESELIRRKDGNFEALKAAVAPVTGPGEILEMQAQIQSGVRVSRMVMDYILNICVATRPDRAAPGAASPPVIREHVRLGASPRATESLLAIAKARAFSEGRRAVHLDDVALCAPHVLGHRLMLTHEAAAGGITPRDVVEAVLAWVDPYTGVADRGGG